MRASSVVRCVLFLGVLASAWLTAAPALAARLPMHGKAPLSLDLAPAGYRVCQIWPAPLAGDCASMENTDPKAMVDAFAIEDTDLEFVAILERSDGSRAILTSFSVEVDATDRSSARREVESYLDGLGGNAFANARIESSGDKYSVLGPITSVSTEYVDRDGDSMQNRAYFIFSQKRGHGLIFFSPSLAMSELERMGDAAITSVAPTATFERDRSRPKSRAEEIGMISAKILIPLAIIVGLIVFAVRATRRSMHVPPAPMPFAAYGPFAGHGMGTAYPGANAPPGAPHGWQHGQQQAGWQPAPPHPGPAPMHHGQAAPTPTHQAQPGYAPHGQPAPQHAHPSHAPLSHAPAPIGQASSVPPPGWPPFDPTRQG